MTPTLLRRTEFGPSLLSADRSNLLGKRSGAVVLGILWTLFSTAPGGATTATPSPTPTITQSPERVLADSIADFSATQAAPGTGGWSYFYYGTDPFRRLPVYSEQRQAWVVDPERYPAYATSIDAEGGVPGGSFWDPSSSGTQSVVRRWESSYSGTIRITGKLAKRDTACGNGIRGRIVQDEDGVFDNESANLWSRIVDFDDDEGFEFDVVTTVRSGTHIDFVLNASRANAACDSTSFSARIVTVTAGTTTPTPRPACTGPSVSKSGSLCHSETWRAADGWVHITGSVRIGAASCPGDASPTLTIEPGVEICFNDGLALDVENGALVVAGTTQNPVVFTSMPTNRNPGAWQGIRFRSTASDESRLEHTLVEYAADEAAGVRGVVSVDGSNPTINDLTVAKSRITNSALGIWPDRALEIRSVKLLQNVRRAGINGQHALEVGNRPVHVLAALVAENEMGGIRCDSTCTISDSQVGALWLHDAYRRYGGNSGPGIQVVSEARGSLIETSVIEENGETGIQTSASGIRIERSRITRNLGSGVLSFTGGDDTTIAQSCFEANGSQVTQGAGRAVRFHRRGEIRSSTIVGHAGTAVSVDGNAGGTAISRNKLGGNLQWVVSYDQPATAPEIDATENWWGTISPTTMGPRDRIHSRVLDGYWDALRPFVDSTDARVDPIPDAPADCGQRRFDEVPADHWRGEYWNNTESYGPPRMVRNEGVGDLSLDFGFGSPGLENGVNDDYISARFSREIEVPERSVLRLNLRFDDLVRIWVDDLGTAEDDDTPPLFLGACFASCPAQDATCCPRDESLSVELSPGRHRLVVEFEEPTHGGFVELAYVVSSLATPTPTATRTPSSTAIRTETPTALPAASDTPTATATPTTSASFTATATSTATSTAISTPEPMLQLLVGDAYGAPGQRKPVEVMMDGGNSEVVGVQLQIDFTDPVQIATQNGGGPACEVNPAIAKEASEFEFVPAECSADACTGVLALIVSTENFTPLPEDTWLFRCFAQIHPEATFGTQRLECTDTRASDAEGALISAGCRGGLVTIGESRCAADCDGDDEVQVDELTRMISMALGVVQIRACPAGDANHDGRITVEEIVGAVNVALNGC